MKLASASTAFDHAFRSGDLTQLEWLERCARELAVDGVVCDVRHFPRHDTDYLAQLKKMAVDLGLTIAALWATEFFTAGDVEQAKALAIAEAIGAPILSAPLGADTQLSWTEQLERLGTATSAAKAINITLAVRNRPGTYAASSHDLKRVSKESDSAWLRYALDFAQFDQASEPDALLARTVLLWGSVSPQIAQNFRGFAVLENTDRT